MYHHLNYVSSCRLCYLLYPIPSHFFLIFWFCVWFVFFHSGHAWPSPQGKTNDLEMLLFVWSTFNNDLEKSMYIWRIIELMWNIKRVQEKVCMKAIIFRRFQYLYSIAYVFVSTVCFHAFLFIFSQVSKAKMWPLANPPMLICWFTFAKPPWKMSFVRWRM